jgi:NTE family protein
VARRFEHRMPRLVRMAMEALGRPDAQSADLMSYLLFDGAYTSALVDIGYRDADDRADELEDWLHAVPGETKPSPPSSLAEPSSPA